MPGATLTQASPRSTCSTKVHGGVHASTSKVRPAPVRRAGSANTAANAVVSSVVASASFTAPPSPSAPRLARATATRSGSRSTPAAVIPAREKAIRSPPMPQPRSTSDAGEAAAMRPARWSATGSRVACSRPSRVKYIERGQVAELGNGTGAQVDLGQRCRDPARVVRGAEALAGLERRHPDSTMACDRNKQVAGPRRSSSQRKASRSTPLILSAPAG